MPANNTYAQNAPAMQGPDPTGNQGYPIAVVGAPGGDAVNVAITSGGGGPVTVADGADVCEGATTDAAIVTDAIGTISGKLRGIVKILANVWDSLNAWLRVGAAQVGAWTVTANQGSPPWQVVGNVAHGSADSGNPVKVGGRARSTLPGAVNDAERVNSWFDLQGRMNITGPSQQHNDLHVTATGAAGAAVTATLPAAGVSTFIFISSIRIVMYASTAQAAGASPNVVTSTQLGGFAWSFPTLLAAGDVHEQWTEPCPPIQNAQSNTAVTIACPAIAGVIWRVNVRYKTGYWPS